jgi:hypothetical protein
VNIFSRISILVCQAVSVVSTVVLDTASVRAQQVTVSQQAYLKASNTGLNDLFGLSVAISGNTAVVGAYQEDSSATGVNGNQNDNFAVNSGAAFVFVRNGTNWQQQAYLKASNTAASDFLGYVAAISGDTIVIGATREDSAATGVNGNQNDNSAVDSGAAYVFVRSGTTWSQQAYLKASNTGAGDVFGTSVAISGDTIVVGAPNEASAAIGIDGNQNDNTAVNAGAAYVFVRTGTNWVQQAYLKASNTGAEDQFGNFVAISADTIVISAHYESSSATGANGNQNDNSAIRSGAAYVFARTGTNWLQEAYLKSSNTGAEDRFSRPVAISGDTILAGAYQEDSSATGVNGNQNDNNRANSGAAYIFIRNGTNWAQQAYLKASNAGAGDFFGLSLDLSGNTAVVGAFQEDSVSVAVNGNGSNNSSTESGAAYVFVRSGTNWTQRAYLKASNTATNDYFGFSVAVSADTAIIGGWGEDSNAIGVNGNQANNSATDSGAAYIFTGVSVGPTLTCRADNLGGYIVRLATYPASTNELQQQSQITGTWETIATQIAPLSGLLQFHDSSPPSPRAFYRIAQPQQ